MPSIHLIKNEFLRAILSPLTNGHAALNIRPTIATVYLTSFCNSRCNMCDFWKNERDPNELTSEQWGVIFSRLKAFGVGFVGVNASGEMFTRPDTFKILNHLHDLGLPFAINSNGLLLTRRRAERLAKLKPRQLTIGMDGVGNDSYLITRGLKRGFNKIEDNIEHLKTAGINNISIGSVLMRENIDEWVKLAEFALKKNLMGVRFTAFHDDYFNTNPKGVVSSYLDSSYIKRVENEIEKLIRLKNETGIVRNSEEYLRRVIDFYKDQSGYFPTHCLQGSNRIEIDVYGNVTLCSFVTKPLGNLVTQEMEEIWQSTLHKNSRNDAFQGNCPHCFLSCYWEENLRLSPSGFLPTINTSIKRATRLLLDNKQ